MWSSIVEVLLFWWFAAGAEEPPRQGKQHRNSVPPTVTLLAGFSSHAAHRSKFQQIVMLDHQRLFRRVKLSLRCWMILFFVCFFRFLWLSVQHTREHFACLSIPDQKTTLSLNFPNLDHLGNSQSDCGCMLHRTLNVYISWVWQVNHSLSYCN